MPPGDRREKRLAAIEAKPQFGLIPGAGVGQEPHGNLGVKVLLRGQPLGDRKIPKSHTENRASRNSRRMIFSCTRGVNSRDRGYTRFQDR